MGRTVEGITATGAVTGAPAPRRKVRPAPAAGAGGAPARPARLAALCHPTVLSVAGIVAAVVGANLLPLAGVVDVDPLHTRTLLAVSEEPGWLPGVHTLDPNDGFTAHALGRHAVDQWLSGSLPYWNHYEGVGAPLAGGMQAAAFFPPVLLLALPGGLLYLHVVLQVLAGVGVYLLLRAFTVGHGAAAVGGTAFAVSGTFVWLTNAVMNPIAFGPWLFLGVELVFAEDRRRRRIGAVIVALSVALSLTAGFPEVAYLNALLAAAWGAVRLVQRRGAGRVRSLGGLAYGGVTGVMLAAPVLVAFATYLPHAEVGSHSDGGELAQAALEPLGVGALAMPYVYGPPNAFAGEGPGNALAQWWSNVGGYVPMTAVALAVAGLARPRHRTLKVFLLAWSALCLAKVFGVEPFQTAVGLIPLMSLTWFHKYAMVTVELAVIVAAALGLDDLIRERPSARRAFGSASVSAAVVGMCALVAWLSRSALVAPAGEARRWAISSVVGAAAGIIVVTAGSLLRSPGARRAIAGGALAVEAMALFVVPQLSAPRDIVIDTEPVAFLQRHLGTGSFFTLGPIAPNYGSYFRIRSVNINDLPIPRRYGEHVNRHLLANVDPTLITGYLQVDPAGPTNQDELYRNLDGFRETGVRYVVGRRGEIDRRRAAAHDLRPVFENEAFEIFELPDPAPYFETSGSSRCLIETLSFDEVIVDCTDQVRLVRRELSMPGWRATVNGAEVAVDRTGGVFQAIDLPAGRNAVEFVYRPPGSAVSWVLFLFGMAALAAGAPPARAAIGRLRR